MSLPYCLLRAGLLSRSKVVSYSENVTVITCHDGRTVPAAAFTDEASADTYLGNTKSSVQSKERGRREAQILCRSRRVAVSKFHRDKGLSGIQ